MGVRIHKIGSVVVAGLVPGLPGSLIRAVSSTHVHACTCRSHNGNDHY